MIGVSEESKAYRLVGPHTHKVVISKDVIFEEHKSWTWNQAEDGEYGQEIIWGDYDFIDDDYEFVNTHHLDQDHEVMQDENTNQHSSPMITESATGPSIPAIEERKNSETKKTTYLLI